MPGIGSFLQDWFGAMLRAHVEISPLFQYSLNNIWYIVCLYEPTYLVNKGYWHTAGESISFRPYICVFQKYLDGNCWGRKKLKLTYCTHSVVAPLSTHYLQVSVQGTGHHVQSSTWVWTLISAGPPLLLCSPMTALLICAKSKISNWILCCGLHLVKLPAW